MSDACLQRVSSHTQIQMHLEHFKSLKGGKSYIGHEEGRRMMGKQQQAWIGESRGRTSVTRTARARAPEQRWRRGGVSARAHSNGNDPDPDGPLCHGVFCYVPKESQPRAPLRIAVTGAAGQIANHLLWHIASGTVFGSDQPVELNLLASERSYTATEGVAMELEDSVLPLLRFVSIGTNPREIFDSADYVLLVGAQPRQEGQQRSDLLEQNGQLFRDQGLALADAGKASTRVLTVGNPVCTMALVASENAQPTVPRDNFYALTRLDQNRAKSQLAIKAGVHYDDCQIWSLGNHSATLVPDYVNATINGRPATEVIDEEWLQDSFLSRVRKRGSNVIRKWGKSSGASTAIAIVHSLQDIAFPTPNGSLYSLAKRTDDNPFGLPSGLICSMPCRTREDGSVEFARADEMQLNDWLRERLNETVDELLSERGCIQHLIGEEGAACSVQGDTEIPGETTLV
jgi:malate dehydrogenase (NADP+)